MVDRETFAAWVLACSLLLAALGSLRDVVTPLGYWVLWAAWALAAIGVTQRSAAPVAERPLLPASVRASYAALILGMLLSAWANHSAVTLYQAVKIGVIGLCCWVAWRLAAAVGWRLRILALQGVVAIVVLVFLASKAGPAGYYLDLGSAGREGSFLAWPGVIWKAGAFFMPLCLAATVTHPGRWIANGLAVAGCVFLVVVDGSRTGLLVVGLTVLAFGVLLVWRREWRLLSAARRALILCVPALFGLLVLSTAIGYLSHGSAAGLAGASSTAGGTAEALVEAAVDPVASTRLGQGDPQRVRLLRNGIEQSVDCLPLGCGFGSTAMDPGYGIAMHVHNAFLGALADFGVLGLAGMLGFIVAAALPLRGVLRDTGHRDAGEVYAIAASAGAALAYMGSLMLHTFSTEMSEWGYLILALAFAWLPSARSRRTAGAGAHEHPETLGCYERRHSRWYEVVLLGWPFQLVAGLLMIAVLPAMLGWGASFWRHMDPVRINTLIAVGLSFVVIVLTLRRLARFSGGAIIAHIAPVVTAVFLVAFAALFFSRSPYSRPILLLAYALALAWCYAGYFIGRRYRRLKLAVVPLGEACAVVSQSNLEVRRLAVPDLEGVRYDAVVADLDSKDLGPEWERFLAQCILSHIPVFHVRQMMETLTGRVEIDHLSENDVGSLLPSPLYSVCKRVIDIAGVLVVAPIALPLMLVTAIAVRLDSPGPALFVQSRVGLGGQDFRIYKFRSMRTDAECDGAQLAATDDDRITRVGAFIRQTRLDELPQLWNVLKGDMSLIGPRPEQRAFVDRFDREIPFYIYRHVVRPGITGWAQVMQGYAGDTDETSIKIQHDFYYIKHFSLWLDILVVFKTVRIILTGWGAR